MLKPLFQVGLFALTLTVGSGVYAMPPTPPVMAERQAVSSREMTYLHSYNACVMAVLFDDAQFKSAQSLIATYKKSLKGPMAKVSQAKAAYGKVQQNTANGPEKLKEANREVGKAELAIEKMDQKLRLDLYNLLSEEKKNELTIKDQRVTDYRNLIVYGDKDFLDASGDLTVNLGIVAALYTEEQYTAAMDIIRKSNEAQLPLQKKMNIANYRYRQINGDITSNDEDVAARYGDFRNARFDYLTVTRKRDLDLAALLSADQQKTLLAYEARVRAYMARIQAKARVSDTPYRNEGEESREMMYLMGYNGALIATLYDEAQVNSAQQFMEKAAEVSKTLLPAVTQAQGAYDKAVKDPSVTTEQLRPLFDAEGKAFFAVEAANRQLEKDLKGLLTEEQKASIKPLKMKMKKYRFFLTKCWGVAQANTGIVATLYTDEQYKTAMDILSKSNKVMQPQLDDVKAKRAEYTKLFMDFATTPEQLEAAYLDVKDADAVHFAGFRERHIALSKILSGEQQQKLKEYEARIQGYLSLIYKVCGY